MELFSLIATAITIYLGVFAGIRWVVRRLRKAANENGSARATNTLAVINWIDIGLEKTIVVPFVVKKTEKVVEKIVVPAFRPLRPRVPEWIRRRWTTPGVRPDDIPQHPSIQRPPKHIPECGPAPGWFRRRVNTDFTRRPPHGMDIGDFTGRERPGRGISSPSTELGGSPRAAEPSFDIDGRGPMGAGDFDSRFDRCGRNDD